MANGVFVPMSRDAFRAQVKGFKWTRKVNQVHMHHTWQPNHSNWQGAKSMRGMYDYHTKTNGWSDIAQHVTIAPDGTIWTGRDWNRSPASSARANGNSRIGPFMFETVGNFDKGHDKLTGQQLESVLFVITVIQEQFGLPNESLKFHRQLGSPKTCPGTSIDYDAFLGTLRAFKQRYYAPPRVSWGRRVKGWFGWS